MIGLWFFGNCLIEDIFILLKIDIVSVFGIGVVVINNIFVIVFFFFKSWCWFILNWCCLFVIIKLILWKIILFWINVWVLIK